MGPVDPSKAAYSCLAGAGAFLSTPSDLVRFGSAMLKPGFLKRETIATMQKPLQLESGESTSYALGWKVESVPLAVAANTGAAGVDPLARTLAEVFVGKRRGV